MLSRTEMKNLLSTYPKPLILKDLGLYNLRYADFSRLNLIGVYFDDCELSCTDFTGAYLKDVSFKCVTASNCIFSRTSIQSATVNNADLNNAIFSDAEIINSNFASTKFVNAKFTNASIMDSSFTNVDFESCDFNYSYLDKISFTDSVLKFAILPEITKWQRVYFINSDVQGTDYEHISNKQNKANDAVTSEISTITQKTTVNFIR
ncbi:MAG: pentapeptide repeat-containing protein [Selenomonadaceae bacterium]|nr:pentapeptide repeat-containing protein [Selenomonadaceae bacterium]